MDFNPSKKLYSFDLFDSLVSRPVKKPAMIFNIIEEGGVAYKYIGLSFFGFKRIRVLAERLARFMSSSEDINLFDIYRVLGWFLHRPSEVLRREVALELALIKPIRSNVEFLKTLTHCGRVCCIVSDMYLPSSVIGRIIRKNIGDVDYLVSSKEGKTKASGNLFRVLMGRYLVGAEDIQHFGDNAHSDYRVPRSIGIESVLLPSMDMPGKYRYLYDAFCSRVKDSTFYNVGYSLVGPCALAFASFIAEDARKRKLDRVIFAARDSYLIKEAFDSLDTGIESVYVRLSRRALYVPSFFVHGDYDKFFEGRVSATEFFSRIGVKCPDAYYNLNPSDNRALFVSYLESIDFLKSAREEYVLLKKYMQDNGFFGSVGFVDLGWRGSLQASISEILGEQCNIHGYYFGSIASSDKHTAFYFQNGKPFSRCSIVFQALPVFEFLFTEPVYTLCCVKDAEGGGFDFEYIYDEPSGQLELRREISSGARHFFNDVSGVYGFLASDSFLRLAALDSILRKYLVCPSREFVEAFRGVGHSEGFGGARYGQVVSDSPATWAGYRNSYWRSAYVHRGPLYLRVIHMFIYSSFGMFLVLNRKRFFRIFRRAQ